MRGHRPWRELVEKTFTPEQRRRMDELRPARMKVWARDGGLRRGA